MKEIETLKIVSTVELDITLEPVAIAYIDEAGKKWAIYTYESGYTIATELLSCVSYFGEYKLGNSFEVLRLILPPEFEK